jgi:hypothetical protein
MKRLVFSSLEREETYDTIKEANKRATEFLAFEPEDDCGQWWREYTTFYLDEMPGGKRSIIISVDAEELDMRNINKQRVYDDIRADIEAHLNNCAEEDDNYITAYLDDLGTERKMEPYYKVVCRADSETAAAIGKDYGKGDCIEWTETKFQNLYYAESIALRLLSKLSGVAVDDDKNFAYDTTAIDRDFQKSLIFMRGDKRATYGNFSLEILEM